MNALALLVLALLLAERASELALNRRHVAWLRERGARFAERDGFVLILAGQVVLFVGTAIESEVAPWARVGAWTWPLLLVLVAAQGLRYWAIATLGPRWSIRVVTLPGEARVASGPYRIVPHPNYVAVMIETVALPLAFGALATAALASAIMAIALARRIRIEDEALKTAEDR